MTEASTIDREADTPEPTAPPLVALPKLAQGIAFVASRRWTTSRLAKKYGKVYTITFSYSPSTAAAEREKTSSSVLATWHWSS